MQQIKVYDWEGGFERIYHLDTKLEEPEQREGYIAVPHLRFVE